MKTSTTLLGVTTLTAAVVGFGATAPSLATNLGLMPAGSSDSATATEDPTDDGADDRADDGVGGTGGTDQGQEDMFWGHGPRGGHGPHGDHGPRMGGHGPQMGGHGPGQMLDTAATTLGLTEDELMTRLQAGDTLGEVADAQGVDRQVLVDALLADQEARLTEMLDQPMPQRPGADQESDDDQETEDQGTDDDAGSTSDT